ncbi:MAG: TonB-dependent receptor plug domain-containing protein, partial [Pseudomonadota bacterium]
MERTTTNPSAKLAAKLSGGVALSALLLGMSAPAFAQDTEQEPELEVNSRVPTIVVTATKRETTLQETPVAVSVVGAEEIQRAEIQDLIDLQTLVPSLTIRQNQTSANSTFFIRG